MDAALDMGVDIIRKLGLTSHMLKHGGQSYGTYNDADAKYFEGLKPHTKTTTYYSGGYGYCGPYNNDYNRGGSSRPTTVHDVKTTTPKPTVESTSTNPNAVNFEQIKYVTEKYDEYITYIKNRVETVCKDNSIDPKLFEAIFAQEITF